MKRIVIRLDETTAKRLEALAPHSRKRSRLLREAVRRLLDELEERRIEAAYRRRPDLEPPHFDPASWSPR